MTTVESAPGSRLDQLVATVARLWPEHDVSLVRGRRTARLTRGQELSFVPNRTAPRLLVPTGHRAAAAAAIRRFSHALDSRERAGRVASAAALRLGAGMLLTDRIRIVPRDPAGTTDSIEAHLSELFGRPVVVSLGVGSARANQKPVLQVFSPGGDSLAYVKVGDTAESRGLVRGEAEALAVVGARTWRRLAVPELLALSRWRGLELLVISALETVARPGPAPLIQPPLAALDELSDAFDEGRAPLSGSAYWRGLQAAAEELPDTGERRRFGEALARITGDCGDRPVRFAAWHGDCAPWNLAWRGDRVQLWDWERFATGVPRGLDRVHYVLNTATRADGLSPAVIDSALRSPHTGHPDCPGTEQQLVTVLYLASITARYLAGAQTAGGTVIRPAATMMLDALVRHGARVTEGPAA